MAPVGEDGVDRHPLRAGARATARLPNLADIAHAPGRPAASDSIAGYSVAAWRPCRLRAAPLTGAEPFLVHADIGLGGRGDAGRRPGRCAVRLDAGHADARRRTFAAARWRGSRRPASTSSSLSVVWRSELAALRPARACAAGPRPRAKRRSWPMFLTGLKQIAARVYELLESAPRRRLRRGRVPQDYAAGRRHGALDAGRGGQAE